MTRIDISSIWFYTFSTSAQVMAALVGLFAVFVVYKIQDFGETLTQTRYAAIRIITYSSANTKDYTRVFKQDTVSMSDFQILEKFSELLKIKQEEPQRISASENFSIETINYALDDQTYFFYQTLVLKRQNILSQFKLVLILTLASVALSLIALVMTNFLIIYNFFIWSALVFFIFCLFIIGKGVYQITLE